MEKFPSIDVIVASKNEENHIGNCLKSVFKQDYPRNKINIIVIDGISSDRTKDIVEGLFCKEINCKILENKKIIQSEAWNLGINNSESDIICILSAHCTIGVDYLKNVVNVLHQTNADLVGGHMIAKGMGYIGKTIEFLHHSKFGIGVGKFHDPNFEGPADAVYTLNFKRSILNNKQPFVFFNIGKKVLAVCRADSKLLFHVFCHCSSSGKAADTLRPSPTFTITISKSPHLSST